MDSLGSLQLSVVIVATTVTWQGGEERTRQPKINLLQLTPTHMKDEELKLEESEASHTLGGSVIHTMTS